MRLKMFMQGQTQLSQRLKNVLDKRPSGSDDTIALKYWSEVKHRGGGNLDRCATGHASFYVESHRVAIVWRSISRGEDEFSCMYTGETGWSVMNPIPPDSVRERHAELAPHCSQAHRLSNVNDTK
ncbi:hypothetical protein PsorP6_015091 [Peronosclerospora sorghi]|uniref:Uncharacterized protein n=1 Tax=Peronosclerospora sorghi TaxID=230839 RepID=A0ACC0VRC3_9STRA|nr:hypothetical protein PsorP6_015091 [Peronosclerospora sorghi]